MTEPVYNNCPACQTALDVSLEEPWSRVECPVCHAQMRVRSQFGHYVITGRIGTGGMSEVFRARDTSLDRDAALKILNRACSRDSRRLSQFEREAEITARISHPNVVKVFTAGRDQGNFYIAMELVSGGSLEELLQKEKRLPQARVLELGVQAVEGLRAAHAAGLIHRDLKPGNILLSAEGTARIVDFGLAMFAREATGEGEIWATPYYVPPEVLAHEPEDFRSDLYSLVATLFHCATGHPPCTQDTSSIEKLRLAKSKTVVLKPGPSGLHPEVCAMLLRGLAIKPADRHASYEELLDHLKFCQRRLGRGPGGRKWTPGGTHGLPLWQKAAAAAAIAAAGAGSWYALDPGESSVTQKSTPPPAAILDADPPANADSSTSSRFLAARQALTKSDFASARRTFSELAAAETTQQPTRHWARFNAVLAALFEGDNTGAANLATALSGPPFTGTAADAPLAAFFSSAGQWLSKGTSVPAAEMADCPPASAGAAGLLAGGLLNWNAGDAAAARQWLEAFSRCPGSIPAWVQQLQSTSRPWLDAAAILTNTPDLTQVPSSSTEVAALCTKVEAQLAGITISGPAVTAARTRVKELRETAAVMATAETGREAEARQALVAAEYKELSTASTQAQELCRTRQFDAAASLLRKLRFQTPAVSLAATTQADSLAAAGDFLRQLTQDLTREPVAMVFESSNGQAQHSLVGLSGTNLRARPVAAGSAEIIRPLSQTGSSTLTAMALHLLQKERDSDAYYRRSEQLYWFALHSGLREFAAEHGRGLARELRSFRARLSAMDGVSTEAGP